MKLAIITQILRAQILNKNQTGTASTLDAWTQRTPMGTSHSSISLLSFATTYSVNHYLKASLQIYLFIELSSV